MAYVDTASIVVPASDLLSALWYSDGSGHTGRGVGIEGTDSEWEIGSVYLNKEKNQIEINLQRKEPPF